MNPNRIQKMADALLEGLVTEEQVDEIFQAIIQLVGEIQKKQSLSQGDIDGAISDFSEQIKTIYSNTETSLKEQAQAIESVKQLIVALQDEVKSIVTLDGEDADEDEIVNRVLDIVEERISELQSLIPEIKEKSAEELLALLGSVPMTQIDGLEGKLQEMNGDMLKLSNELVNKVPRIEVFSEGTKVGSAHRVNFTGATVTMNNGMIDVESGGLPSQTGNNGKFLTTDGTDASWATLAGGGDMAAAVYDPQAIGGDAFDTDNHTDGTTNKVYTATEKTKLAGIEASADVTDTANVTSAGALMDSEVTNLAQVKAFSSADYATAAQGAKADAAPTISSGAGAPGSTPTKVGDIYIDTTGDDAYIAVGTSSSTDWEKTNDGAGGGISDGDKGDITVSASGATWTIDNDVVTYAKMQNVSATDKVLGRTTAGAGDVEEISTTGSGNVVRATSPTLVTPVLGTPSSGTLTNCTGLPLSGVVDSTTEALGVGSLEVGHASDTTITRVSAGVIAVEGTNVSLAGHTHTLANVTDVTASAAEVNVLDGIPGTLTATELGYVDGVTSAIQTQLDAKLASSAYDDATAAEVNTGTSTTKYVSPDALAGSNLGIRYRACTLNGSTALTTDDKHYFRIPAALTGMNLVSVSATVGTGAAGSSSSGTPTFTVKNVTDAQQMLSTSLTVDAGEYTSATATTAAVINTSFDDVVTDDLIEVACTTAGTGVTYAEIVLGFQLP